VTAVLFFIVKKLHCDTTNRKESFGLAIRHILCTNLIIKHVGSYGLLCTAIIIAHKGELSYDSTTYENNIVCYTFLLISMKVYTGVEIYGITR
jgi:hypothetical protein